MLNNRLRRTLEAIRKKQEASPPEEALAGKSPSPWKGREIATTAEFQRIAQIPERDWEGEGIGEELAVELTELLREGGTEELYPTQAMTLHDLYTYGRAVGVIRVGGGKSRITFLAPYVVKAERPLLIVPGNLVEKTKRHLLVDSYNWKVARHIRIESYEMVAHVNHQELLHKYKPDLIMLDEASCAKNAGTVTAKQIRYYVEDCERGYYYNAQKQKVLLPFVLKRLILSGTLTGSQLEHTYQLLKWGLMGDYVPLPERYPERNTWSLALDPHVSDMKRYKPGPLLELCPEEEREKYRYNPRKMARIGYRRRLITVPGVVCMSTPFLGASLQISAVEVRPPPEILAKVKDLRLKWKAPDGSEIQDAHVAAMRAKEVTRGLWYRLNPYPPEEYIEAKRAWGRACRKLIADNRRRLDSEGQVVQAMKTHGYYPKEYKLYQEWQEWKEAFGKENVETMWESDFAIDFCINWMKKHPRGIVWVGHKGFGKRLAKKSGVSYYGAQSVDKNGRFIEDHPHNTPMIASLKSNYQGKNLQFGWSQNLLTYPIKNGEWYEQFMGRTHREGQPEDIVTVEIFMTCIEDYQAFWHATEQAEYADDMESDRKLQYADITVLPLAALDKRGGVLWKPGDIQSAA